MTATMAAWALMPLALLLLGSRLFYRLHLRRYARYRLAQLGSSLEEVKCSLDRMIFLVPLPTYEEDLRRASVADIGVEMDVSGWLFPELKGIRVMLLGPMSSQRQIAYMIADQFTSPTLDRLLLGGKLDRRSYGLVCRSLLVQPGTLAEIRSAAHKRLQSGPFNPA